MKRANILIIIVFFLIMHIPAFAQLSLDKYKEIMTVTPGQTYKGQVTIDNSSRETVTISSLIEDVRFLPPFDGAKEFVQKGATTYSCGDWISVTPESFMLPPGSKQRVSYSISVPNNAKGSYYSILLFKKENTSAVEGVGIGMVLRVGLGILLETPDIQKVVKIEDIKLLKNGIKGSIVNNGESLLYSNVKYYVMDGYGKTVDRGNIREILIPVQEKALFETNISPKLSRGKHTLLLNFDLGGGELLVKEIDFEKSDSEGLKLIQIKD